MDNCFNIPELVIEICSHCQQPELARLGRTARLFDFALDMLWSELAGEKGVIRLFECLSEEVVLIYPNLRGTSLSLSLKLWGGIKARHWDRFSSYAKRVRFLDPDLSPLPPDLVDAITDWAPLEGILPNLRTLSLTDGVCDPRYLHLFLSPKLENLSLRFGIIKSDHIALMVATISALPTRCPALTALDLDCTPLNYSSTPLLEQFTNLHELSLSNIRLNPFPEIPRLLSKLTKVNLEFLGKAPQQISDGNLVPVSLESLRMEGSPNQILGTLDYISQSPLQCLSLNFRPDMEVDVSTITCRVADRCAIATLRQIVIYSPALTGNDISPLFTFQNIQCFECSFRYWLYPDDSFIATLGRSWPRLVSLRLRRGHEWPQALHSPKSTIHCLEVLVSNCPDLAHLSIQFDATIGDNLKADITGAWVANSRIQTLCVERSTIDAAPPVAAYLSQIFPQLKVITTTHDHYYDLLTKGHIKRWAKVQEILSPPLCDDFGLSELFSIEK